MSKEVSLPEDVGQPEGANMKQDVFLPDDYRPAEDEPFMNDRQLE
jgi:DnaK suppressor protein